MVICSQDSVTLDVLHEPPADRTPKRLPTPEEIAAECAAIRAGWSPTERRRAMTVRPLPWMIPQGLTSHRRPNREDHE